MTETIILPSESAGFHSCIVHPGFLDRAWVSGGGLNSLAIILDVDPEAWKVQDLPSRGTCDQDWPKDAARLASSAGHEPAFIDGLPMAGAGILSTTDDWYWHHLTLAFVTGSSPPGGADEWRRFREAALKTLVPADWHPSANLRALLHVAEADYVHLLARSAEVVRD